MAKRVVCIEVGVRFTRICETTESKQTPQVFSCATFATPVGAVEDGYIRDKTTLSTIIRQKMQDMKIKATDVIFTLNSTKIASREVFIPYVKENKIKSIVDMQASEYFPIDITEYTISYYQLNAVAKDKSADKKIKLLLLAAPNVLVQSYYSLAESIGLHVASIDYIGNSFYQLAKRQLGQGVNISIHINENTSIINIVENENLLLQRIVPYGTNEIVERVKENALFKIGTDEEAVALLCKEKLINYQFDLQKEDLGLSYAAASESYDRAMKEMKAREDITDSFRFLMNHVVRVLDYFTAKNSDKKIGVIYLSGLGARFQGVVHLFKNELGYDVRRMENLFSASFVGKNAVEKEEQPDYISCIGASIAPAGFELKGVKKSQGGLRGDVKTYAACFTFCACLSGIFIAFGIFGKLSADIKNRKLNDEITRLSPINQVYAEHDATVSRYNGLLEMYNKTVTPIEQLDLIINDIEKKMPCSMTVQRMNVENSIITLGIKTDSKISVAKLIMSLSEVEYISSVNVASIAEDISKDVVEDSFDVSFIINKLPEQDLLDKLLNGDEKENESEETTDETVDSAQE